MALGDFQVFKDFSYRAFENTFQQQVNLFNAATRNGLMLTTMGFVGDQKQKAAFENLASLVGNRDPGSTSAASEHALKELLQIDVKVGWELPNISYTNTSFDWTQRSPEEAGTLFGNAVAEGAMAYQLNSALAATVASMDGEADVEYDGSAATASLASLNLGAAKFGDRQSSIVTWVMHSKSMNDIYGTALANSERLFEFGTVQVMSDGFGRPLVMTDSSALTFNDGVDKYIQLGLVAGGAMIEAQGDTRIYTTTLLDQANAREVVKAEGSFGVGIKGYTFNPAVTQPDDTAIALPANWSRVTDLGYKDSAGVKVTTL